MGVEELRSEGRRSRLGWTWAAIREAFGIKGGTDAFPMERRFENEGVLAYHGHVADAVSSNEEGPPFAELFCPELITRFPLEIRKQLDLQHPHPRRSPR